MRADYTFTDGRVIVRGNLTSSDIKKRADYSLFYKINILIAIIDAKDRCSRAIKTDEYPSQILTQKNWGFCYTIATDKRIRTYIRKDWYGYEVL